MRIMKSTGYIKKLRKKFVTTLGCIKKLNNFVNKEQNYLCILLVEIISQQYL